MYDTVNFWIDRLMVGGNTPTIAQYLTDHSEHNSARGYYISGRAGDYLVSVFESGISIKGSLAKYLLSDNIHTLTRSGTRDAIQKLSDELHLPANMAKVSRVDLGTGLLMSRLPNEYYPSLGNKSCFQRLQATHDTLYYKTGKRQLVFYDKKAEAKSNGVKIPMGFENTNLLRVEARFTARLPQQLKQPTVTGATLYNEQFYSNMVKLWASEYHSINKLKSITFMDTSNINTPKDGVDAIFSFLLQEKGPEFIKSVISDLKAKNTFPDPKYYSRLKGELNRLIVASTATEQSELIRELDKAVNEIVLYCR